LWAFENGRDGSELSEERLVMVRIPRQRKLRRERLSDQLTTQLRKYILENGLRPGDPLLTEEEMVERFGVSRTVVREATKALDFLGIIHAVPRRGMVLGQFDFARAAEYFGFHFALSDYPKETLLKTRLAIESGALYYAMDAIRKEPRLADGLLAQSELLPVPDEVEPRIQHDIAFHRALIEATGITPLAAFCDLIEVFFRTFRDQVATADFASGQKDHRKIVEALCKGDVETATRILRHHVGYYETILRKRDDEVENH
jgi:DNA-binding FadR family transcriptional regulator